ncbi:uncharacterized protein LOC128198286 [Bicyclus anynana]|uniref:Uncharacterized protein LOC128198286 n=1 Tax=Bicyclus anynana TaxID=110368 RepID=A0ABM3LHV3_BICAN|nr:uncharacterized protein LOC128198286 [Bicyclus anynana]
MFWVDKEQHNMNTVPNKAEDESCFCTTSLKSELDDVSLRRMVDLGSRIDRLYLGKYIPLREQKLLQRLARTRAVYDDIRAQIISDSTVSHTVSKSTKCDDCSRHEVSVRDLDDTEISSAVLGIINMADRGEIGTKKLHHGCSCCSCSSEINIHEPYFKRRKIKRPYISGNGSKAKEKRRSNKQQAVRLKTKPIRSDPCTCTFESFKKHSKQIQDAHLRPPSLFDLQPTTDEEAKQKRRTISEIVRTSNHNLKQLNICIKDKISKGMTKVRKSHTRLQELLTKNQPKDNIPSNVTRGTKEKIVQKYSHDIASDHEISLLVKNDSFKKSKEGGKKQIIKYCNCDSEPEKCILKLKHKKISRNNQYLRGINYNIRTEGRKAGESLRQMNHKIQAQKLPKGKIIKTRKPALLNKQTRQMNNISFTKRPKIKKVQTLDIPNTKKNELRHKYIQSDKNIPGLEILTDASLRPYQYSRVTNGRKEPLKNTKWYLQQQGSQIKLLNDTKTRGSALKRCYCALKLKVKTSKSKNKGQRTNKFTFEKPASTFLNDGQKITGHKRMQGKSVRTKPNCVCQCDSHQNIQLKNARKANDLDSIFQVQDIRSTSSLTTDFKKSEKDKYAQSLITFHDNTPIPVVNGKNSRQGDSSGILYKQAVRVDSSVSFNIKFDKVSAYGDQNVTKSSDIKSLITPKQKTYQIPKLDNYKENLETLYIDSANQMNKRYFHTGFSLRRCCNKLKLHIKKTIKKFRKKMVQSTKRSGVKSIDTSNKSTKIESKYLKSSKPCECEPITCISGEINPYICIQRAAHNKRLIEAGSNTTRSKSESTSSATYPENKKSVEVRYKLREKEKKMLTNKQDQKRSIENEFIPIFSSVTKSEQSIKIGSTLSFKIELYKNKLPTKENKLMLKNTTKRINNKEKIKRFKIINVGQIETQVQGPWTHKGSVASSILKRCNCSLNLQKKKQMSVSETKRSKTFLFQTPRIYTVARVMIKNKHNSIKSGTIYSAHSISRPVSQFKKYRQQIKELVTPNKETFENNQVVRICSSLKRTVRTKVIQDTNNKRKVKTNTTTTLSPLYVHQSSQQHTITRFLPRSNKSVSARKRNLNYQTNQTNFINTDGSGVRNIVEMPKFRGIKGKRDIGAVKIGSNVSFSIEFNKKKFLPQSTTTTPVFDNFFSIKRIKRNKLHDRSKNSFKQTNSRKTPLKRCFCCLDLNSNMKPKVPFHQTIKVGRVSVQNNPKLITKELYYVRPQSLAANLNQKIKNVTFSNSRNQCLCQDNEDIVSEDIKTILPYMPKKINGTSSTTILPPHNEIMKSKKRKKKGGKRLTRKRSHIYLNNIQTKGTKGRKNIFGIKYFIRYCTQILRKNINKNNKMMFSNYENSTKPNQCLSKPRIYEKTFHTNPIVNLLHQSIYTKQECNAKTCKLKNIKPISLNVETNTKRKTVSNKKTGANLAKVRSMKDVHVQRNKVRFLNTANPTINLKREKKNIYTLSNTNHPQPVKSKHTQLGRIKINKEELFKGAGDRYLNNKRETCFSKMPLFEMQLDSGNYNILNKDQVIDNVIHSNTKCKKKPLIEVQLDSKKFHILNKEEVFDKVIKTKTKRGGFIGSLLDAVSVIHRKSCKCQRCDCASRKIVGEKAKGKSYDSLKHQKYKNRRVGEHLDHTCDIYMASLRKRRFLSVYRMFPSFYPHFLSLLHAWKQFMEILMFILAAVVWSPCILCMELCRACMCCFFCTG